MGLLDKTEGKGMVHARGWKSVIWLCIVLALLSLELVQAEAQTQPAAGRAKVERLVMGLITPYLDYIRPWINGTAGSIRRPGSTCPGWPTVGRRRRTAGRGTSSSIRECNSTMAMVNSPPRTWCTTMLYGVT